MKKQDTFLIGNKVGIELIDGTRLVGKVVKWDSYIVYLDVDFGEPIDVPRNIIQRMLVSLPGNKV